MARVLILTIMAASLCAPLSGCGTVGMTFCGITGPIPMYYGVQADVQEGVWLDLPFSAVADTALLPLTTAAYTFSVCHWWTLNDKEKEEWADRCPIPWEWKKFDEIEKQKAAKQATEQVESLPTNASK
ncbi:hypothetical protein BH10PLA2_BH10PLA2_24830 [soil metagenome]